MNWDYCTRLVSQLSAIRGRLLEAHCSLITAKYELRMAQAGLLSKERAEVLANEIQALIDSHLDQSNKENAELLKSLEGIKVSNWADSKETTGKTLDIIKLEVVK